jgi:SAM-dependent methyltransferase
MTSPARPAPSAPSAPLASQPAYSDSSASGHITLESMAELGWYNEWLLGRFAPYLRGDVLEAGSGIGTFTKLLARYGRVTAVDVEEHLVRATASVAGPGVRVGRGDLERGQYFFGGDTFDAIVCLNVLEHIERDDVTMSNFARLLRPGGHLALLVPAHMALYGAIDKSIGHYRRYDKARLQMLAERSGLQVVALRRLNLLGAVGWWLSSRLLRNTVVDRRKVRLFNLLAPLALKAESLLEPPLGISLLLIARKKG